MLSIDCRSLAEDHIVVSVPQNPVCRAFYRYKKESNVHLSKTLIEFNLNPFSQVLVKLN